MNNDLAYLAGFFDGEGCITIRKQKNNTLHSLAIEITQKGRIVLDWIEERYGGHTSQAWNGCYVWNLNAGKAKELLIRLYPYLVLKKEQAKYGVIFQNVILPLNKRPRNSRGYPAPLYEEELELRRKIAMKLHGLKTPRRTKGQSQVCSPVGA